MKKFLRCCWALWCLSVLACLSAAADGSESTLTPWRVVVDFAPFAGVESAATGEGEVDWGVDGSVESVACTLSYAAVELRDHLRQVATAGAEVVVWDDETVPERALALATLEQAQVHPVLGEVVTAHALTEKLTTKGGFALVPLQGEVGGSLAIIGYDRTGTLYGAYELLERQGVRWYGPEAHEWHLPERAPLTLPDSLVIEQPDFATRGFWVREDKGNVPFYHWMARNRLNFWSIAEPNRALLHKLGLHLTFGGHHYYTKYMDPGADYPFDHPGFEGDEHLPADPYGYSTTEFTGDVDGDGRLTFFEAHPEWYGLNAEGEREPFEEYMGMNLCTSNQDSLDYLFKQITAEVAHGEWVDVASLNFWAMDNGIWCSCPACEALGEPTDRLMLMVHGLDQAFDVARAGGELQRNVQIIFPIYQGTLPPPTRPLPADFDYANCIGTFFPILRCYVHRIDDPACAEYNVEHWQSFTGWAQDPDRHYRGELFVGEYYNVSVNRSLPVLYTRSIREDLPTFYRGGARHLHYMHTDTHVIGVKRINNYLFSRVLWDVAADQETEIAAYYDHLYGPAAAEMRALCEDLEFAHANIRQMRYWHHLPERLSEASFPVFDKQHFQLEATTSELDDGVDLAESVATYHRIAQKLQAILTRPDLTPDIRRRLVDDERTIRYGEHTVHFYDAVARAVLAEHDGQLDLARAEFARSLPHARALRAEREVTNTATHHFARSTNGFNATRLGPFYAKLATRLGFDWQEQGETHLGN